MARRHLGVVPNVGAGMGFEWESDLLILTKSLYLTEIEIKISASDFRIDAAKHKSSIDKKMHDEFIRRFFYAAPKKLAEKILAETNFGVISIDDQSRIEILRKAPLNKNARKMTERECLNMLRLAALKAWDMAHRYKGDF